MNDVLIARLKESYDVRFNNLDLLAQAFTHSSYVNEHRNMKLEDNERLEFLGDAVLELSVSRFLYHFYPELPEGKLTKIRAAIVCEDSLAKFAKECQFDEYVCLGRGEENSNGRSRPSLLCDLFEAFLGALYLDQGIEKVEKFLEQVIYPKIRSGAFSHEMDYKTTLQEKLQQNGDASIEYVLVREDGPAHDRQFWVDVYAEKKLIGSGTGKSKKNAEQQAAAEALNKLLQKKKK